MRSIFILSLLLVVPLAVIVSAAGDDYSADYWLEKAREFNIRATLTSNEDERVGYYELSLISIEKSLDLDDSNEAAWKLKGEVLYELDRGSEALECLDKAIEINPLSGAWELKASIHYSNNEFNEALEAYNKVLLLRPFDEDALAWKANVLVKLDRYEEAIEYHKKYINLNPRERSYFWGHKVKLLESLLRYEEAIDLDPSDKDAWRGKAKMLEWLYNEGAIESYDKIIALDPSDKGALLSKAKVLEEWRRYEEAIESYDKVIAQDPSNSDAWFGKAEVLEKMLRYEEAIESYDKARES